MGDNEVMRAGFAGVIAIAMSLVGFITVWVRLGQDKGRQETMIAALKQKTEENAQSITELKNKTHGIELRIAEFMGEIRVKLDNIKETVSELKPKEGRHATKK